MSVVAYIENGSVVNTVVASVSDAHPSTVTVVDVTDVTPRPGIGWSYANGAFTAPTVTVATPSLAFSARVALEASDTTVLRIQEAISLGKTTATTADVVAWMNYRVALRAIVAGTDTTSTALPTKPAYPANT